MKKELQKQASRYIKVVEWSDEDGCFVGQCPELFAGGCHGADEAKVYKELCSIVEEVLEDMAADGRTAPAPLAAQKFSGKFMRWTPFFGQRGRKLSESGGDFVGFRGAFVVGQC